MSGTVVQRLSQALKKIDRPGSFCVSGSLPTVLPGLEVTGLGPVALPLTAKQVKELKKHCEQAPYGQGTETLVDTQVRRVWRLKPERFSLTNPDWGQFLQQITQKVQEGLGLEKQELQSHLYELLLYEPGSFFLPHRDGEKHDRMVATLVVVLPSAYQGGELVVHHEGQEKVIPFGAGDEIPERRVHFAAFYADCQHEVRPLEKGHRLCLVYNLTMKRAKKGGIPPPPDASAAVGEILRAWAKKAVPSRLAVPLDHQYTPAGLAWDALKGADRGKAQILLEAARQADCQAHLALLTLHESGAAEYPDDYPGWGWEGEYDEEVEDEWKQEREAEEDDEGNTSGNYKMEEVFESSLTADHWSDADGNRPPFGSIPIPEDGVVNPKVLRAAKPEEKFEGYTGNEGMSLDRWYRRAAIVLWPIRKHFDTLCDAGTFSAIAVLQSMVQRWQGAPKKEAPALQAECVDFAATIIARWQPWQDRYDFEKPPDLLAGPQFLLSMLVLLDEVKLVKAFVREVLPRDAAVDPGELLPKVCQQFSWKTLRPELEAVFTATTSKTLGRNMRLLEAICLAKLRQKKEWEAVSTALARQAVLALERVDGQRASGDYQARPVKREEVLGGLVRALLAIDQADLLMRLVEHILDTPKHYPLETQILALTALGPWLKLHVKKPCPGLANWLDDCCGHLEGLTAKVPPPPADFRRPAAVRCNCADCEKLKEFLKSPSEGVYRFAAVERRRRHLEDSIRYNHCDVNCRTERKGTPHTLVCTKNDASYQAKLKKHHEDLEHLAVLRSIRASLPAGKIKN